MTTVLFAGGGSGGHLFPGVAVAEELMDRNSSVRCLFVGSDRPIEKQILSPRGFEHVALSVSPSSNFLKSPVSSTVRNWRAYQSAQTLLKQTSPAAVVGLGGFASLPVVVAAWRRKMPVVLLEQNAVLGRANRALLPFAHQICLSFSSMPLPFRYRSLANMTGNPMRREIVNDSKGDAHQPQESHCLLILGGSQGAAAINAAVVKALPRLRRELSGWTIIHQTGSTDFEAVNAEYIRLGIAAQVVPFLTHLGSIYPRTTLAISRAGGTSLAELAVHAIPSLLIPYPGAIRDHQTRNAEQFAHSGGAIVLKQGTDASATANRLCNHLRQLLTRADLRASMGSAMKSLAHPDAARRVADLIFQHATAIHRAA